MTLTEWLLRIAKDREIRGEDLRVLLVLMAHADINTARVTQGEIARIVELTESNVSRSIRNLVKKEIVSKEISCGKVTGYRFSFND